MAQAIIATITDTARSQFANMLAVGRAFTVTDFVTGNGGVDMSDPANALSPDPTATVLPNQSFGPAAISSKSLISPFCVQYVCNLGYSDAVGPLSNLGLIATYIYSPIPGDPLIGTTFLFAVANYPLIIKNDAEQRSYFVNVQF